MSFFKKPSETSPIEQEGLTPPDQPISQDSTHVVMRDTEDMLWDKDLKAAHTRSKYRLIGAVVLVLLALIFLPMMLNTKREQVWVTVQSPGQPDVKVLAQNMRNDEDDNGDIRFAGEGNKTAIALPPSSRSEGQGVKQVPESIAQKTARLNNTLHPSVGDQKGTASAGKAASAAKGSDYNTVGEAIYAPPVHKEQSSTRSPSRHSSTSSASRSSSQSSHRVEKKRSDDGRYAMALLGGETSAKMAAKTVSKSASKTKSKSPYTYQVAFPKVSQRKLAERTLAALTLKGVRSARIDQFRYKGHTYYRTLITGFDSMSSALQMQTKIKRWHLPSSVVIKAKR